MQTELDLIMKDRQLLKINIIRSIDTSIIVIRKRKNNNLPSLTSPLSMKMTASIGNRIPFKRYSSDVFSK